MDNTKNKCKLVLVGDQNTGKSSLIYYLINDIFTENSLPTIGISFNDAARIIAPLVCPKVRALLTFLP